MRIYQYLVSSACEDKEKITNSIAPPKVTQIENGLEVEVKIDGKGGVDPEFAIAVISSNSIPGLDHIVEVGKTGMKNGRSRVVPINKVGATKITFIGLDSRSTYYVHVSGYRCEASGANSNNNYLIPWKTVFSYGERAIFRPLGGSNDCYESRPIVERIELTNSSAKGILGSLFHVRMKLCNETELSLPYFGYIRNSITHASLGFPITNDNLLPSFEKNLDTKLEGLLEEVLGSDNDGAGRLYGYSRKVSVSDDLPDEIWVEVYFFLKGTWGGVDFNFSPEGEAEGREFYASVPTQGVTWLDQASKKLAGMLESTQGATSPKEFPTESDDGTKLRILSGIVINQLAQTGKTGEDMSAYISEMWPYLKNIQNPLNRISPMLNNPSRSFAAKIKAGTGLFVYPSFNATDALASQSGWVKVSDKPFDGLSEKALVQVQILTRHLKLGIMPHT